MPRVKRGVAARARHRKVLRQARGYAGARSRTFRAANQAVIRAAYRDRRARKRDFRRLWIVRINAAARLCGLSYSRLMRGLARAGVGLDRRMLADLAMHDFDTFAQLAERARAGLSSPS